MDTGTSPVKPYRAWLCNFIRERQCRTAVEVGVYRGELSRMLAAIPSLEHLILVDPLEVKYLYKRKKLWQQKELDAIYAGILSDIGDKITFIRETSLKAAASFPDDSTDLVFIDADHDYEHVHEDILAWKPKVKAGGVLCGDDYIAKCPGVIRAVNELLPDRHVEIDRVWWTQC